MTQKMEKKIIFFDDRRDIIIPGNATETIAYCAEQFVNVAEESIKHHECFNVALSGGSTPKAIFQLLATPEYRKRVDWSKVNLFWSDERCVPPEDSESNYHMAMTAGFATLPIPKKNIFRMPADSENQEEAAHRYENILLEHLHEKSFDLVTLGMGEDRHTASLFPKTHGLHVDTGRLVIANYIPQKETWRMSFTFECINSSRHIAIYVIGKNKAPMVSKVLTSPYDPDNLPIQQIGTRTHKALWILDAEAASLLKTY